MRVAQGDPAKKSKHSYHARGGRGHVCGVFNRENLSMRANRLLKTWHAPKIGTHVLPLWQCLAISFLVSTAIFRGRTAYDQ